MIKRNLCMTFAGTALLAALVGGPALAADWRLAVPTSAGLGFVDPSAPGPASITLSGAAFGQVDEVVAVNGGARLFAAISTVASGTETILAFDTRSLKPTGTTSLGGSMFGVIPNQTVALPDGKSIIVVGFDGNVNVIDFTTGKAVGKPVALGATPFGADISGDGSTVVVGLKSDGDTETQLSVALTKSGPVELVKTIALGKEKLTDEEVSYKLQVSGSLAAVYGPNVAYIADLASGKVKKLKPVYNKKTLTPIGISRDGKTLLCRYADGATGIFALDASTGKLKKRVLMKDPAFAVGSEDGSLIYVASPGKATIGVFDANTMSVKASYPVAGLIGGIKLLKDPKDSTLAVPKSLDGNIVVVCDIALGGAADAKETFAGLLQKQLAGEGYGIPVVNSSSSDGLAQAIGDDFDSSVKDYAPAICIIEVGQADILAAQADAVAALPEDAKADAKAAANAAAIVTAAPGVAPGLDAAITKSLALGLKTIIVCPLVPALQPIYEAAAAKHKVPLVMGGKAMKDSLAAAYPTIIGIVSAMAK